MYRIFFRVNYFTRFKLETRFATLNLKDLDKNVMLKKENIGRCLPLSHGVLGQQRNWLSFQNKLIQSDLIRLGSHNLLN